MLTAALVHLLLHCTGSYIPLSALQYSSLKLQTFPHNTLSYGGTYCTLHLTLAWSHLQTKINTNY